MTRLNNVKKLEERIAPSTFAASDGNYRCGNGPNGEVGGYEGGWIDPNASPSGADANGEAYDSQAAPPSETSNGA